MKLNPRVRDGLRIEREVGDRYHFGVHRLGEMAAGKAYGQGQVGYVYRKAAVPASLAKI